MTRSHIEFNCLRLRKSNSAQLQIYIAYCDWFIVHSLVDIHAAQFLILVIMTISNSLCLGIGKASRSSYWVGAYAPYPDLTIITPTAKPLASPLFLGT